MPHLVIEYAQSLDAVLDRQRLMSKLSAAVAETGIAQRKDLKVRMMAYSEFMLNDGSVSFIHLTLSLLEGRTPDQKETLAIVCRDVIDHCCPEADAVSVDIHDMDPGAYKKRLKASLCGKVN